VTGSAKVSITNKDLARVLPGRDESSPLANGKTELLLEQSGQTVKVPVEITPRRRQPCLSTSRIRSSLSSPSWAATPVGCHGKSSGQNGFRLSLLGFEPDPRFSKHWLRKGVGDALFPAAPDESLLLKKGRRHHASWRVARRWRKNSDEYKTIRRWIAAGMPWGDEKRP